jgi:rare lipoprotein A
MASRARTLSNSYALFASVAVMFLGMPMPEAQTPAPVDTFEDRFFIDGQSAPTFTRPEVVELFATVTPLAPNETVAFDETSHNAPGPLSRMILPEPKGPAKVLKDLLNTPVKELLVTKAEAGPDVPSPPSGQGSAELSASRQEPDAVMARAAEPILERPTGGDVTTMPPPRAAASIGEGGDLPSEPAPQHHAQLPQQAAASPRAPERTEPLRPQTVPTEQGTRAEPQPARSTEVRGRPAANDMGPRRIGKGRAAWYQHPGRTASGETFNPNQRTAAHHTLPLGTKVRVVSEKTGRSVIVRINDRIPRKTKILIDLSRASARAIGLVGTGTVSLYKVGGQTDG